MVNNFRLVERKKNGSDISKTRVVLGRVLKIAIYFFIAFLCGEVTARLDDYMRYRIPFLDQSSLEEALKIKEFGITRGRPNGRYQRWHLNGYGFRSSQFNIDDHSKRRIMILGASA
jgi:hypothetical protein